MFSVALTFGTLAAFAQAGHLAVAVWNDNASCSNAPSQVAIHNINRCHHEAGSGYWKYSCSQENNGIYNKASAMFCGNDSNCYHCTDVPTPQVSTCIANGATKSSELLCASSLDSIGLPEAWLSAVVPSNATYGSYFTESQFTTNGNHECAVSANSLDQLLSVYPTNNCLLNADGQSAGKYSLYTCDGTKATVYDCGADSTCKTCTAHVQPLGCSGTQTGSVGRACRPAMTDYRFVDGVEGPLVNSTNPVNGTTTTADTPSTTTASQLAYTTPGDGSNTFSCGQVYTDAQGVHTYNGGNGADALATYTAGQVFTQNGFYFTYTPGPACAVATQTTTSSAATTTASQATGTTTSAAQTTSTGTQASQTGSPTDTTTPTSGASAVLAGGLSVFAGLAAAFF